MRRGASLLGILFLSAACGGGGTSAGGSAVPTTNAGSPARGPANLILEAEIMSSGTANALEAIQRLRPTMLRGRGSNPIQQGTGSANAIMLYVDGVPAGTIDQAANINALSVKEIRFINASDATTRFGTGHPMGAILITTKRR